MVKRLEAKGLIKLETVELPGGKGSFSSYVLPEKTETYFMRAQKIREREEGRREARATEMTIAEAIAEEEQKEAETEKQKKEWQEERKYEDIKQFTGSVLGGGVTLRDVFEPKRRRGW